MTLPRPSRLTYENLRPHIEGLGFNWDDFIWLMERGFTKGTEVERGMKRADGTHPNIKSAKKWVKVFKEGRPLLDGWNRTRQRIQGNGE